MAAMSAPAANEATRSPEPAFERSYSEANSGKERHEGRVEHRVDEDDAADEHEEPAHRATLASSRCAASSQPEA